MSKTKQANDTTQFGDGQVNVALPVYHILIYFISVILFLREASTFTVRGDKRIGRKYNKVVYREYTSAEFTEKKTRTAAERHLGVLGPILHAEVGDTIEVTFKNLASGKFSMHPHGLFYRYAWGPMRTSALCYPGPVFAVAH